MVAGALLVGCATTTPKEDDATFNRVAPKQAASKLGPKAVEVPVSAEARIDPMGDSRLRGSGRFAVDRGVVTMDIGFTNLPPGTHAISLQESCDGAHWNPTHTQHGRFDVPPFHLGDVGNFFVNEEGHGAITFTTELWSVGTGLPNDVVDKYVVVHASKDDFSTQPTGGSGRPLGCGRIELSQLTQPAVSMTGRLLELK
jgi:Cu-Zn family superoxide dismutase